MKKLPVDKAFQVWIKEHDEAVRKELIEEIRVEIASYSPLSAKLTKGLLKIISEP